MSGQLDPRRDPVGFFAALCFVSVCVFTGAFLLAGLVELFS